MTYNQLYLALPVELDRVGAAAALGWLFAVASVLVVLAQVPIARLARDRLGARRALVAGFLVLAVAFGAVAVAASGVLGGRDTLVPAVSLVVLLTAGQMLVAPVAHDVAARLAGERHLGVYFGVLSGAGGLAVLAGSAGTGLLLDAARVTGPAAVPPWAVLTVVPVLAAAALWRQLRDVDPRPRLVGSATLGDTAR